MLKPGGSIAFSTWPAGMHIAPDELAAVRARLERDYLTTLGYRFAGDPRLGLV